MSSVLHGLPFVYQMRMSPCSVFSVAGIDWYALGCRVRFLVSVTVVAQQEPAAKTLRFRCRCKLDSGDSRVNISGAMSAAIAVNVAFQAKSGSADCTPETVQMNTADMKTLKVKTGAYVEAVLPFSSVLLQVWPSKKALAGSVALNRIWQPNFALDQRKIKVSPLARTT